MTLVWDLRDGHGIEAVGWPERPTTAIGFPNGTEVILRLPGDRIFHDRVRLEAHRAGAQLDQVALTYPPMTGTDASRLAGAIGRQWGTEALGPHGPVPAVEIVPSFEEERPVRVRFVLAWG